MIRTISAARLALVSAALLLSAPICHGVNLITNGSFETPLVPVGSFTNFPSGSLAITGWQVVGVDSAVTSGSFVQSGITFQAQDGVQYNDLAGVTSNSPTSGVMQTIATSAGALYELKFYVGSALDTQNGFFFPSTVDLSINGGSRVSYLNPASPSNMLDWRLFTVNFTATGPSTTLTFLNGSAANNFLSALDNVSVEQVPEPATVMLAIVGLVVAGTLRVPSPRFGFRLR